MTERKDLPFNQIFNEFCGICANLKAAKNRKESKRGDQKIESKYPQTNESLPAEFLAFLDKHSPLEICQILSAVTTIDMNKYTGLEIAIFSLNSTCFAALLEKMYQEKEYKHYLQLALTTEFIGLIKQQQDQEALRMVQESKIGNECNQVLFDALRISMVVNEAAKLILAQYPKPKEPELRGILDKLNSGIVNDEDYQNGIYDVIRFLTELDPPTLDAIRNCMIEHFNLSDFYVDTANLIERCGMRAVSEVLAEQIPELGIPVVYQLISREPFVVFQDLFDKFEPIELAAIFARAKTNVSVSAKLSQWLETYEVNFDSRVDSNKDLHPLRKKQIKDFYVKCKCIIDPEKAFKRDINSFIYFIKHSIPQEWDKIQHHDAWINTLETVLAHIDSLPAHKKPSQSIIDYLHATCGLVYFSKQHLGNQEYNSFAVKHWLAVSSPIGLDADLNELIAITLGGVDKTYLAQYHIEGVDDTACRTRASLHLRQSHLDKGIKHPYNDSLYSVSGSFFNLTDDKHKENLSSQPLERLLAICKSIRKLNWQMTQQGFMALEDLATIEKISHLCELGIHKIQSKLKQDDFIIDDNIKKIFNQIEEEVQLALQRNISPVVLQMQRSIEEYKKIALTESQFYTSALMGASEKADAYLQQLDTHLTSLTLLRDQFKNENPHHLGVLINLDEKSKLLDAMNEGLIIISIAINNYRRFKTPHYLQLVESRINTVFENINRVLIELNAFPFQELKSTSDTEFGFSTELLHLKDTAVKLLSLMNHDSLVQSNDTVKERKRF